jgi:FdrA protein
VARAVLERIGHGRKPFTVCFLGGGDVPMPPSARAATTLQQAAELAVGDVPRSPHGVSAPKASPRTGGRRIRGLYSGGTLCAEAQIVLQRAGLKVSSNVPVPGATSPADHAGHSLIDLGDDAYTRGRPHPMIEPAVRDVPFVAALDDPAVAVVLIDIVLGLGGHPDPAGHVARLLRGHATNSRPALVAAVTGTDGDPQGLAGQVAVLREAGVTVCDANAEAAMLAARLVGT